MNMRVLIAAVACLGATSVAAATLDKSIGYGLTNSGNKLVLFSNLGMPSVKTSVKLSGKVDGIAYRPVTGELYGYVKGKAGKPDDIVRIDANTGALTSTGATFAATASMDGSDDVGFDFNNQIDAARAVGTEGQNLVFFPSDFTDVARQNTVARFTDLFYAVGDVNEGSSTAIFANAYTNAVDGMKATATLQYAIDAKTNALVTLQNNDGILRTIGDLGFDVGSKGGFDIVSMAEGDNLAVAILKEKGGNSGLYQIDLTTGAATLFSDLGKKDYNGFAAQVAAPAPVPVPATLPLLAGALVAVGAVARSRRKR